MEPKREIPSSRRWADGLLSIDVELHGSRLHHPPDRIVWMKLPLRFRAGGKLNVVGVQKRIEYDGLFPRACPLCDASNSDNFQCGLFGAIQLEHDTGPAE
jgi:hypothetical protein